MDLLLIYGFLWLLWLPSYVSQGIASVVLERACEVYQNPGTYLAYQGDEKYLTCSWNGTDNVNTFTWTLNGNIINPNISLTREKKQRIKINWLDDSHAGNFACNIRTVSGVTSSASLTLQLQGLPVITASTSNFVYGNNVTLTCEHSIINVTQMYWVEDGNSLYQLGRSWVTVHGNATYARSITVNLRKGENEPAERYECRIDSEALCGGSRAMTRMLKTQASEIFEVNINYPIELELSTYEKTLGLNDDFNISCEISRGDLPANVAWYKQDEEGNLTPISEVDTVHVVTMGNGGKLLKIYKAKPYMAGSYVCRGRNGYGEDLKTVSVNVLDRGSSANIIKLSEGDPGVNRRLELLCYDDEIDFEENATEWFKDGVRLSPELERYSFSDNRILIPALTRTDEGSYYCRYADENHPVKFYSEKYQLVVIDFPPQPINLTINSNLTTENSLTIQWTYSPDEDTVATTVKIVADFSVKFGEKNPDSLVQNTIKCVDGVCPTQYTLRGLAPGTKYMIEVISVNDLGESPSQPIFHSTNISQQLTENSPNEYVMKLAVGITAGVFVLMCALGYIFFRRHKKDYKKKVYDKIERELGFTIPKTLRNEYVSNEYEYKNLKFLDTLGEGAFGKVLKAEAAGLKCPQGSHMVAVKMCREENEYDKNELLAEIDILTKLGVHQHVIPLLGVCTKPGRPVCLITQYMVDGDLQNYLRNSRASFVGTYPFKAQTEESFQLPNISQMSNLCTSDDTLTSKDLISFARQISCGMEYVASQKIVHRDLAARNVLVASKRSLKITDFGLAREMRGVNEEYVMGPNRKVPYRWLAPESFFEKKFTVHSDVWAYGVLLYEILTLGGSPYPRHTIRDIPEMLKQGYRMSPPTNSKPELNQLMSLCWHEAPESRPSFTEIKNLLDELLGDRPEEYLDCGDPEADILPNLNSNDNKEMDNNFRYSFMSTATTIKTGDMISSIAAQGYDRIADAHSAYGTLVPTQDRRGFSQRLNEIKSNPIPDTYQHLPVMEPSPGSDRKNSAQYVNHDTGLEPVIVKQDFMCGTENFVAQKL